MNDTIISLGFLIEELETRCNQKHGRLDIAKRLMNSRYLCKSRDGWAYFECLKAALVSDGSLENADVRLTECLHRYAQSKPHGKHRQVVGKRVCQSC